MQPFQSLCDEWFERFLNEEARLMDALDERVVMIGDTKYAFGAFSMDEQAAICLADSAYTSYLADEEDNPPSRT